MRQSCCPYLFHSRFSGVFAISSTCYAHISVVSHGSIYFASDAVSGAVPTRVLSPAPTELKEQVSKRFTIGPTVVRDFWKRNALSWTYRGVLVGGPHPTVDISVSDNKEGQVRRNTPPVLAGAKWSGSKSTPSPSQRVT